MSRLSASIARAFGRSPEGRLVWVAVIVLAALAGILISQWPLLSVVAVAGLALVAATMISREFALGAILASSLLTLGAISWLGFPSQAGLLTKVLIGLFVLGILLDWTPRARPDIPVVFIILLAALAISAWFGGSSRLLAAQALGAYLAAPIIYLAIVNSRLEIASLRRLSLFVACIIAIQVPIIFAQSRIVTNVDDMGGTFGLGGSTQMLAIVFGITWTIAVALLSGRKAWWLVPICLALATALAVNQAKAGFLFMGAGTIVVGVAKAVANPRKGLRPLVVYTALGVGAVLALYYGYVLFPSIMPGGSAESYFWTHWLTNPTSIMGYLTKADKGGQAGRLGGTTLALSQARSMADLLIGHGPGLLSGSALAGQSSVSTSAIGFALGWATSLTRFVFEVGLLGIGLYLGALGVALATVAKAWIPRGKALGISVTAAAFGAAAVYVAGSLYHAPWTTDAIAVPFWCLLGMAVRWGRLRAAEQEASVEAEYPATAATEWARRDVDSELRG